MLLLTCLTARGFDFADTLPSGQVLYYSYVAGGVEVVHPNANVSTGWVGYTKPIGSLTIPARVSHDGTVYTVTAVGDYAFRYCTGLTSVVLSDGIASVGNSAFYSCTGIVELTLPASMTSLGNGAFSLLGSLSDVWITLSARASNPNCIRSFSFSGMYTICWDTSFIKYILLCFGRFI